MTVLLITLVFYYHSSTSNATPLFRTVTILPEIKGRVEEIYIRNFQLVKKGDPLFLIDSSSQQSIVNTAESALNAIKAEYSLVKKDLEGTEGQILSVESELEQAKSDLERMQMIATDGTGLISERDLEFYETKVGVTEGELDLAFARRDEVLANLNNLLPARQKTAEAELEQANVEFEKTVVYAMISGRVTQFMLQPGDIVNPFLRPAGLLVLEGSGTQSYTGRIQPTGSTGS